MRASLHFNLPEEREEHLHALSGSRYKAKIDDLYDEVFRPILKYDKPLNEHELTDIEWRVVSLIWAKVSDHFKMEDL
jgi:hypothetical protein